MIEVSPSDIGRRVVYDPRPVLKHRSFGRLVAINEHSVRVQFDGFAQPLNVISNLHWADGNNHSSSQS